MESGGMPTLSDRPVEGNSKQRPYSLPLAKPRAKALSRSWDPSGLWSVPLCQRSLIAPPVEHVLCITMF